MKNVRVILKADAEEEFERLNKIVGEEQDKGVSSSDYQRLLKSIKRAVELLKENPQYGDSIPKNLIRRTGLPVSNLWRVELSGYWRMLYTIVGNQVEIICYVLETMDHRKYDRLFGYRKKRISFPQRLSCCQIHYFGGLSCQRTGVYVQSDFVSEELFELLDCLGRLLSVYVG